MDGKGAGVGQGNASERELCQRMKQDLSDKRTWAGERHKPGCLGLGRLFVLYKKMVINPQSSGCFSRNELELSRTSAVRHISVLPHSGNALSARKVLSWLVLCQQTQARVT